MPKKRENFDSLIGMDREKRDANISIKSCKARGVVFPHTLLYGIGGLGKTAFVRALSVELDYFLEEVEAAALRTRERIIQRLVLADEKARHFNKPLMFFVDEVHRLSLNLQETFYYPMKESRITTADGDINFDPFTFMAATTRLDLLDADSFVARFPNVWEIRRYEIEDLCWILDAFFRKQRPKLKFTYDILYSIAERSLGIPRIVLKLGEKVRDFVLAEGQTEIKREHILAVFELLGIDSVGLEEKHRRYLELLSDGRPKRITIISRKMRMSKDVVVNTIEPILVELEMIDHVGSERIITKAGLDHLESTKIIV